MSGAAGREEAAAGGRGLHSQGQETMVPLFPLLRHTCRLASFPRRSKVIPQPRLPLPQLAALFR